MRCAESGRRWSRAVGLARIVQRAKSVTLGLMAILAFVASGAQAQSFPSRTAEHRSGVLLIRLGLAAQGGELVLRALSAVSWRAKGYRNALEQSERPEGPWLIEDDVIEEIHDLRHGRIRQLLTATMSPFPSFQTGFLADREVALRLDGAAPSPGNARLLAIARETLALSPERLLLTALAAPDLRLTQPTSLQGLAQDTVSFTLDSAPVRLYLNPYTHLPTALDYSGPLAHSGYWAFRGDNTLRILYSSWCRYAEGIRLPLQQNIEHDGLPDTVVMIDSVRFDPPSEETLQIGDALRRAFEKDPAAGDLDRRPLGDARRSPLALEQGVTLIPGAWNVTIVCQDDGIVIIEAPISSGYSSKVAAEAHRRCPALPIKAVVTTSDAWPHIAGIREYAAIGVSIYVLDLNRPIVQRTLNAAYTWRPDRQALHPKRPHLIPVASRITLGSGPNRLELIPIRGETTERQMMVWFPAHRLLYGSDGFQKGPDGRYGPSQTVDELMDAVTREGIVPSRFYMMHTEPDPWAGLGQTLHGRLAAILH